MNVDARRIAKVGLVGALVAVAANLVIYLFGRVSGVEFGLTPGGFSSEVGPDQVIIATVVTFAIGTALAVLVGRKGPRQLRVLQILGALAAVVTAGGPLSMAVGNSSKVLLLLMHLVAGTVYVLALERVRRPKSTADQVDGVRDAATS